MDLQGTFQILGNQAAPLSTLPGDLVVIDGGVSDGTFGFTIGAASSIYPALAFRVSDASSYWYVNFDGTTVYVNTMVAGTSSVQTSGAATGAPGDVVRVVCSGSTVQLKINGVAAGSLVTNSFNATATKVGLTLRAGSAAARWDSFLVTVP